ncbi:MAG TPA: 30S ribosomal protein S16 [Thermotogota bacterium]|nr:30S ribosomal protein S16 [Thermotogota bacterium]HRW91826.1 30S ribosomal protein S16 [Thermotogota bacterium]
MVKIRLTRMGKRKMPFYRVVVMDSKKRRDGAYLESLGFYDPIKDPALTKVNIDRAIEWLLKGAQPTDTVRNIFSKYGIMDRFDREKNRAEEQPVPEGSESQE